MAERMARVLAARGSERVLVVHGDDGLDELTTTTTSTIVEVVDGEVRRDHGRPHRARPRPGRCRRALSGGDAAVNAAVARAVLAGEAGAARDVVVLNAARRARGRRARSTTSPPAWPRAAAAIDDGGAAPRLDRLVAVSQRLSAAREPTLHMLSRSCLLKAWKATIVSVAVMPSRQTMWRVTTSASSSCSFTRIDRDEVGGAGDRVDLGDASELGQLLGEAGDPVRLGVDEDERMQHAADAMRSTRAQRVVGRKVGRRGQGEAHSPSSDSTRTRPA